MALAPAEEGALRSVVVMVMFAHGVIVRASGPSSKPRVFKSSDNGHKVLDAPLLRGMTMGKGGLRHRALDVRGEVGPRQGAPALLRGRTAEMPVGRRAPLD